MHFSAKKKIKISDLMDGLDASLRGDGECLITGISSIQTAKPGEITFLNNGLYKKFLSTTKASAIILSEEYANECKVTAIISKNPYYTYSRIAQLFHPPKEIIKEIHPSVVIGKDAVISNTASIGAQCVIGNRVRIAENVVIGPGCIIGDDCDIGANTELDARVTLYHHVSIGKRAHLCSGVVIGSDGFGFANQNGQWHKVPQLGGVIIGDDVDIGANTTIDRGAIDPTIIEDGVKLDNLIQIAHNVKIGKNSILAGCVAIAGSTVIGKNCMIGGAACFAGHITVCDNTLITGMTAVTKSITSPGMYSSGIVGAIPNKEFRKNNARFHRLENLMLRVKKLEAKLKTSVKPNTEEQ